MSAYQAPAVYLPHKAPMVLLDRVCHVGLRDVRCEADVSTDGVLAPFLDQKGNLPAWFALELMAQSIGVWSGWHARTLGGQPQLGMLLGGRALKCEQSYFSANLCLEVSALQLLQDERLGSFECQVKVDGVPLASARLNVYQPNEDELEQLLTSNR